MQNSETTFVKSAQTIKPVQLVTPAQAQLDSASVNLPDGSSPVAIIMAISVLIGSIAGLIKVLVPVMLQQPHKKTK
jgi:hypothetical protein